MLRQAAFFVAGRTGAAHDGELGKLIFDPLSSLSNPDPTDPSADGYPAMMDLIAPLLYVIAGFCGLTTVQFGLLAWQSSRRAAFASFAALALCVAIFEISTVASYHAATLADYVEASRWLAHAGGLGAIASVCFASFYSGRQLDRWGWSLIALVGGLLLVNQFSPAGIILLPGGELSTLTLPWGETVSHVRGRFNLWSLPYYGSFILVAAYNLAAGRRLMRAGSQRQGLALAAGAVFMSVAMASDTLMESQLWEFLYFSDYAFVPLVLMMNAALVSELVGSNLRLRRLNEASFECVFFTRDSRIIEANDQLARMFGRTLPDLLGRSPIELIVPDQREAMRTWVLDNTGETREAMGLRGDGSIFPIEIRAFPHELDGRPAYVTVMRDITERRAATAALKESEEKYAKIFRSSPDAIIITRIEDGRILEINERFITLFGYTREELIGHTTLELGLWSSTTNRNQIVQQLHAEGTLRDVERKIRRRDGTIRDVLLIIEPIGLGAEKCAVAILRNITARKQAELALRTSEERFELAVRGTSDGVWDWNLETKTGYHTPRFEELLGFSPGELQVTPDTFPARIHPDDAPRVEAALRAHFEARAPYDITLQVRRRDGHYRWFRARAETVRNADGKPVRIVGSLSDVHEHRLAEEALRRSEAELRAIFEGAAIGILLVDMDGRLLVCNPAFSRMVGYTVDELRGTPAAMVTHPDDLAQVRKSYTRVLSRESDYLQSETRYIRKDGSPMWARRTLSAVHGDGDSLRCFASMIEDITEQKRAEESLHLAREREHRAHAEFAGRLLLAQEQERKRIATELHDSLGQHLSLIKNRVTLALDQPDVSATIARHLGNIAEVATAAISEVRILALGLRPLNIERFGLTSSLESLLEQVGASSTLQIERRLENVDDLFTGDRATHIYRILQEALNNLLRHAHATQARVRLERDLRCIRLRIHDNGRGFDPAGSTGGGLGLTSMRERASLLHGILTLHSAPGAGTEIIVEIPFDEPPAA